ncbi:MAG: hypothetical protein KF817_08860 [Phycisphaeraceae bacterium]|nr:hypothetical protein [Phycisphaeraceae bacterium]
MTTRPIRSRQDAERELTRLDEVAADATRILTAHLADSADLLADSDADAIHHLLERSVATAVHHADLDEGHAVWLLQQHGPRIAEIAIALVRGVDESVVSARMRGEVDPRHAASPLRAAIRAILGRPSIS